MKSLGTACRVAQKKSIKFPEEEIFVIYVPEDDGPYQACTAEELETFFYGTPDQNIKAVFCAGEYQE